MNLLSLLLPLLLLGAIKLLPDAIALVVRRHQNKKLALLGIEDIDRLGGRDFERLLTQVFWERGAKVVLTPRCNDWGADLVIEKEGIRTVVQAKRWRGRVGVKAVQEVVASKAVYKAERAMVVTNSTFTKAAIELARKNEVELWGRDELIERLLLLQILTRCVKQA